MGYLHYILLESKTPVDTVFQIYICTILYVCCALIQLKIMSCVNVKHTILHNDWLNGCARSKNKKKSWIT